VTLHATRSPEVLVVGSGASAVAAAWALLDRGVRVCMLDGGLQLEPERAAAVARLRELPRSAWTPRELEAAKGKVVATAQGVEDKLLFGSSFVFRGMDWFHPVRLLGAKMYQTLAEGGLSNVWGASILPALDADLAGWPLAVADLAPHYRAVLAHLPFAAREDDVAQLLPLYDDRRNPAPLTRQAVALLADLDVHRAELSRAGITYGQSRLALRTSASSPHEGCSACALCMYGCPWDHIWSSRHALRELEGHEGFRRVTGQYVERLAETADGVAVALRAIGSDERASVNAAYVVLAAGVASSARVVLSSLEAYNRPVRIQHSEHFQFPMMRLKGVSGVTEEAMHTLSQVYLELQDPRVSEKTVHLQVYTYNDFFSQVVDGMLGPAARFLSMPAGMVLGRLLLLQSYLHSDVSSHVVATLAPGQDGALTLEGKPNPEAARTVARVTDKLGELWRALGARVVPGMVSISKPGAGNHSGGSFPMRTHPGPLESDTLGRPSGFARVHVVDASVLPSIPATTLTFTVMANAHRIGARLAAEITGAPPPLPRELA